MNGYRMLDKFTIILLYTIADNLFIFGEQPQHIDKISIYPPKRSAFITMKMSRDPLLKTKSPSRGII